MCQERAKSFLLLGVLVCALLFVGCVRPQWAEDFAKFESEDGAHGLRRDAIVFVGSSSIRRWPLERSFPDLPVINRGLGGSQIDDAVRLAERLVFPYAPRAVVLYAGDNDVASGKSPEQILLDYRRFVAKVRSHFADCRVIFVSIKPSPARWRKVEQMREANRKIASFSETDPRLYYADIDTPMIGDGGLPRAELYAEDGLHLTDEGYAVWTSVIGPFLRGSP